MKFPLFQIVLVFTFDVQMLLLGLVPSDVPAEALQKRTYGLVTINIIKHSFLNYVQVKRRDAMQSIIDSFLTENIEYLKRERLNCLTSLLFIKFPSF